MSSEIKDPIRLDGIGGDVDFNVSGVVVVTTQPGAGAAGVAGAAGGCVACLQHTHSRNSSNTSGDMSSKVSSLLLTHTLPLLYTYVCIL